MEKYGFVYIWRDRKHKRYYIGSHWGTEDDGYICSSNWMYNTHKRRPEDFKRRILARVHTTRADTFLEEERWLKMIKPEEVKKRYYNLRLGSRNHCWGADRGKTSLMREKVSIGVRQYYENHPDSRESAGNITKKRYENLEYRKAQKEAQLKRYARERGEIPDDRTPDQIRKVAREKSSYVKKESIVPEHGTTARYWWNVNHKTTCTSEGNCDLCKKAMAIYSRELYVRNKKKRMNLTET